MLLAVVDDDVDVRTALNRLLHGLGHQVRLPGLNGLELREQMRAAGRILPLVFITGDGDWFLGNDFPADVPTLRKPFDEESLVAILDRVVPSSRQLSE
jgi:FixJ family two-component response regulator